MTELERRARLPQVAAAVSIGAALGLVVYRFGVLGFGWRSPRSFVFPAVACVLAAIGAAAIKLARPGGPRAPVLAGLGGAGAVVAMAIAFAVAPPIGSASLAVRALPGFTIELPPGDVVKEVVDYQRGSLRLARVAGTGAVVAVHWERGKPSRDDLELAARALEPTLGKTAPPANRQTRGPHGAAVDTLVIESTKGEVRMSFVGCGVRRILVTTAGDAAGELHDRIVPTIACRPDPALEAEPVGLVPIAAELPGWFAIERRVDQIALSDGTATLVVRGRLPAARALPVLVPPILDTVGVRATLGPVDGDRLPFVGTLGTRPVAGWARRLVCDATAVVVVAYAPDRATADRVAHQVAVARCLRPGEARQVWPAAPR